MWLGSAASPMASPISCSKLERSGYAFDSIIVSGGAARSELVRQIIADVCNKTVESPETPEPVLLGSAMVGAVAAGDADHDLRNVVDVDDRARRSDAGRRGDCGVPRAKAPMPARCCAELSGRFVS